MRNLTLTKSNVSITDKGITLFFKKKDNKKLFNEIQHFVEQNKISEVFNNFDKYVKLVNYRKNHSNNKENIKLFLVKKWDKELPDFVSAMLDKMRLNEGNEKYANAIFNFLIKLEQNPNKESREDVVSFVQKHKVPITFNGDLLFEKGVDLIQTDGKLDFVDCHTGTIRNTIGSFVSMPREDVNDNRRIECSTGLHCAVPKYVREYYGNKYIIDVLVNPSDIVSIPLGYDGTKIRCSKYYVLGLANQTDKTEDVFELEDFENYSKEETYNKISKELEVKKYKIPYANPLNDRYNDYLFLNDFTSKELLNAFLKVLATKLGVSVKSKSTIIKHIIELEDVFFKQIIEFLKSK